MTSTKELSSSTITIFPNPTSDNIVIKFEKSIQYSIEVYNLLRVLILTENNESEVSVSNFQCGQYFIVIKDTRSGEKVTRKIIVTR